MKIILNSCYGGFGVSPQAIRLLIDMKADCLESDLVGSFEIPKYANQRDDYYFDSCYVYYNCRQYYIDVDKARVCPHLISLIEEHGSAFVSGMSANLEVVEISFDVNDLFTTVDGYERLR